MLDVMNGNDQKNQLRIRLCLQGRGNLIIFNKLNLYYINIRQRLHCSSSQSQETLLSYLQIVGYILYPDGLDVCIDKNRKL